MFLFFLSICGCLPIIKLSQWPQNKLEQSPRKMLHCILHTWYCIRHTECCVLYTIYYVLYTLFFNAVNCIQCGEYFIQVYCIPYNVCCKLYTLNCILYAVYCTLYTVYYILCSVHRRAPWSFIGVQMWTKNEFNILCSGDLIAAAPDRWPVSWVPPSRHLLAGNWQLSTGNFLSNFDLFFLTMSSKKEKLRGLMKDCLSGIAELSDKLDRLPAPMVTLSYNTDRQTEDGYILLFWLLKLLKVNIWKSFLISFLSFE